MITIDDKVLVGDSDDGHLEDDRDISAILNVAHDLGGKLCWPDVEYAQVGLIDGPGNEVVAYTAALLTLVTLTRRHDLVLVYDHSGSRALAIGIMYLSLVGGKVAERVDFMRRRGWEEIIGEIIARSSESLPRLHKAHVEAFNKVPFGILEALL